MGDIDSEAWSKIKSVYRSVDEIDLFVGGLAEKPEDGIVGPTFACIIGKQFRALMEGDRFFHHHTDGPGINPIAGAAGDEISSRTWERSSARPPPSRRSRRMSSFRRVRVTR